MHTITVMAGGFVLLGVCLLVGHLAGTSPSALANAARYFIPIWLVAAAINMWVGVARAGYSIAQEAPDLPIDLCCSRIGGDVCLVEMVALTPARPADDHGYDGRRRSRDAGADSGD